MEFPRIIYHQTDGIKTDYGYTYRQVDAQEALDDLLAQGWFMTPDEVLNAKSAAETDAPVPETETPAGETNEVVPETGSAPVEPPAAPAKPKRNKKSRS